jgi:acyl-CoA synthetase (AMP-forming)/AMP-acid ligase II
MTDAPIYTYGQMLRAGAAVRGDADALVFPDRRLSHAELYRSARAWAKAFIAIGIQPGQNVGILLTTRPEFVELLFGIVMTGAIAVPVNARYQAHELAFVVKDADLVTLVTTGKVADQLNFAERLQAAFPALGEADPHALHLDAAPMLRRIICVDPPCQPFMISHESALQTGADVSDAELDARIDAVDPEDIAFILYTSGTTANPKGALISHRAIIGNSRNLGVRYRVTAKDKVWSPLPIFHIAGILPLTMVLDAGGAYLTVPHFDAGTALAMLGREGATVAYPSFVTIMQDLITHPSFAETDLSKLRLMNSNFAVQPAWIKEAMTKAMPHTVQVGTYGLTEGAGTICTSNLDDSFDLRTGRLGMPLDEWDVRIVDIETGKDCGLGERGEIVARGPNMLKGYYNAPEKSAEVLRGGWFHTGDIGSFDESGHIMFHGRTKDMLKVGGENVAAAEIESMLQTHPAVKLAQVVGIPDSRYVEVPAAFVELTAGASATEAELIAHCKGQLASFKLPRHVRFVDEWPMSTSKIQKYRLRTRLVEELGLGEVHQ